MSWDGSYASEREYPIFEIGTEVYPKKRYKSLSRNKPYIVLDCFTPPGFANPNIKQITVLTDAGYKANFASYYFKKTERQLMIERRAKKIDLLLS